MIFPIMGGGVHLSSLRNKYILYFKLVQQPLQPTRGSLTAYLIKNAKQMPAVTVCSPHSRA
jgi:hypothetical protein